MYTVIVADDEEEIRRGIIKKVKWEELGFQVIGEAANGADALELVEKLEPDLLLTDIRMPFLSGIDLARSVREVCPTVQIAFLSGFDDFSYAQQAIQYNIISYMLKPISSLELEGRASEYQIHHRPEIRGVQFPGTDPETDGEVRIYLPPASGRFPEGTYPGPDRKTPPGSPVLRTYRRQ